MNPPTLPTDNRTFVEKLRETHMQTMNMGPTGPVVALFVFFSSSVMMIAEAVRTLAVRCERLIRRT